MYYYVHLLRERETRRQQGERDDRETEKDESGLFFVIVVHGEREY